MRNRSFTANGITYRQVPPGVYEIPLGKLADLRFGELLSHSTIEVVDLPTAPADHEFHLSVTNGGDADEDQFLSIFAGVFFSSDEHRQLKLSRIRRAYLPLVERGELPEAFVLPATKDRPIRGVSFNIDLGGRPKAVIRDEIRPILQLFRHLSGSVGRVFICHATEDKSFARRIASYLREGGAEVWLDEWEIKIGDSIVERIDAGLRGATHVLLILSTASVTKPWVKRELSSALMRQLADSSVRLLPVLISDCEIPYILSDLKYADCRDQTDGSFEQILHAISVN
jgi:hypothetical protein